MRMRNVILVVFLVFAVSLIALADSVDVSCSPSGLLSVSLDVVPDIVGDVAVVFDLGTGKHSLKTNSKGDMTVNGDYEIWEGKRSSSLVGLGYRIGDVTPWIAISSQSTKTTKHEMQTKGTDLVKVIADMTEPTRGVAFGINAEQRIGSWGVSGTLAKMPEGVLLNARLKYRMSGIGTAHVGYIFNGYTGAGIVAGLGISY